MKTARLVTISVLVALCAAPTPASASGKTLGGALLVVGGAGAIAAAFDYRNDCPSGYSTHTAQNLPTQCVHISSSGSDVRQPPTTGSLARPMLLKAGLITVGAGIVVLMLPARAAKFARVVDVSVSPTGGWQASKTVDFSKR